MNVENGEKGMRVKHTHDARDWIRADIILL